VLAKREKISAKFQQTPLMKNSLNYFCNPNMSDYPQSAKIDSPFCALYNEVLLLLE
jgi:hypothetical protein